MLCSLAKSWGKITSAWSFLQKADISLIITSACFFWLSVSLILEYYLTIDLRAVCLNSATNSFDSITPVSWMSFSVGTYIFSLMNGLMAMERGARLHVDLLSPQVYSTILSIVSPSLLWQEVTSCTSSPLKSSSQQQPQHTDLTSISKMYFSILSRQQPLQQNLKREASMLCMIFQQREFYALLTQQPYVSVGRQGKQIGRPNIMLNSSVPRESK